MNIKWSEGKLSEDEVAQLKTTADDSRKIVARCTRQRNGLYLQLSHMAEHDFPELSLSAFGAMHNVPLAASVIESPIHKLRMTGMSLDQFIDVKHVSRAPEQSRHNVYNATFDGEELALKEFNVASPAAQEVLESEIAVLNKCAHPHIMACQYLFVQDEHRVFVAFKWCNSGDLSKLLGDTSFPAAQQAATLHSVLIQVLRAIEHLHLKDIVHCDIKVENVLLHSDAGQQCPVAMLSDFELSQCKSSRASMFSSSHGRRGTLDKLCMAPEVWDGQPCSFESDMYSFGGVMFSCLFPKGSTLEWNDVDGAPKLPERPFLPKEALSALTALLHKEPSKRPTAAQALALPFFANYDANLVAVKARFDAGISPVPSHWTLADPQITTSQQYLLHNVTTDIAVFSALQECLAVDNPHYLGKGRDQRQHGKNYTKLELQQAWRVENPSLWSTYQGARNQVHGHAKEEPDLIREAMKNRIQVRKVLYDASSKLPRQLDRDVNEVFLLHGTEPTNLNLICRDGVNDKFSGGLFHHATYLAEDAQKNDQYVTQDLVLNSTGMQDMHLKMYSETHMHPGEVFYIIVCRVTLGYPLFTTEGRTSTQNGAPLFHPHAKVKGSQLNVIPGTNVAAHSLVAETGQIIFRNREFMIYNKSQVYPEYVLAYKRK